MTIRYTTITMFKPQYNLTSKLLTSLTQIERLYGQIEAVKIPKKLELNLNRDNLIQSAYVSNSIEGNPLSLQEVTNLLLDDRVPTNRDEKEVTNYFAILKSLSNKTDQPLSLALINQLHLELLKGVKDKMAGKIRNSKVVIGKYLSSKKQTTTLEVKHEPPAHSRRKIENLLLQLFNWTDAQTDLPIAIKAGIFHHQFVYIHPYSDGNGRICRLLTALIFLKNNYQVNKYFLLDDYYDIDRSLYSDKLHTADQGDKTEWLEYFSQGIMYSLQSALARVKQASFKLKIEERPTKKEKQVIEFIQENKEVTSTDVAKHLKVSRQQAHNLLKALVEKGFLKKQGSTKSSFYSLL